MVNPTMADRVEALCFLGLTASLGWITISGSYTSFATPRTLPYLLIAIVILSALTVCAWLGLFHATPRRAAQMLVALAVPALLIAIPAQARAASGGFDKYAGGRAIAIDYSSGQTKLAGLDEAISISNDNFGAWYQVIDHNPQQYAGYTLKVTGFVSKPSTLGPSQLLVSRQFMSCCILDMTPFGFTASYDGKQQLHEHDWVQVSGMLQTGTIGDSGHTHQGLILQVDHITTAEAPTGYFYQA